MTRFRCGKPRKQKQILGKRIRKKVAENMNTN